MGEIWEGGRCVWVGEIWEEGRCVLVGRFGRRGGVVWEIWEEGRGKREGVGRPVPPSAITLHEISLRRCVCVCV